LSKKKGRVKTMRKNSVEYYLNLPYKLEIVPDTEEGGYVAYYPDLPGCFTSAETLDDIIGNAQDAEREWIKAALAEGMEISEPTPEIDVSEYSGQFKLRIPKSLHKALSINARNEGISMNQYCLYLLSMYNEAYSLKRQA